MKVIKSLRAPVLVTVVLLLICGLIYRLLMTPYEQALFPSQANGSIIYVRRPGRGRQERGPGLHRAPLHALPPSAYHYKHLYGGSTEGQGASTTTTAASTPA